MLTSDVGFTWGPYFKHVFSYWDQRTKDNLLIVSYEDMQEDLPAVIRKVANFLDIQVTADEIKELTLHLSFDNMKANKMTNLRTESQVIELQ